MSRCFAIYFKRIFKSDGSHHATQSASKIQNSLPFQQTKLFSSKCRLRNEVSERCTSPSKALNSSQFLYWRLKSCLMATSIFWHTRLLAARHMVTMGFRTASLSYRSGPSEEWVSYNTEMDWLLFYFMENNVVNLRVTNILLIQVSKPFACKR